MKVRITVVAMDEEAGIKSTLEEIVEVPKKVVKLHEMFGADEKIRLRAVGQTVFTSALKALGPGGRSMTSALMEGAPSGRVGGRAAAPAPQQMPPPTGPGSAPAVPQSGDPLSEMLGLDLIRHANASEVQAAAHQPQPPPQQQGPGVAGFPRR